MRKRQAVADDQVWTKEFVPLFLERSLKLTNILVALEPGTSLVTDFGQCPCPSGPGIVTVVFCFVIFVIFLKTNLINSEK